jgi:hypothetical protein
MDAGNVKMDAGNVKMDVPLKNSEKLTAKEHLRFAPSRPRISIVGQYIEKESNY